MSLAQDTKLHTKPAECFHCGNDCLTIVKFDGHNFCCNGCKTVYQILDSSALEDYYKLEDKPGVKPAQASGDFEFLELPEVKSKIILFENDELLNIKLYIPQIHCSSCIYLLEQLHQIDEKHIQSSYVNFQTRELSLTVYNIEDVLKVVFRLLNRLGYTPQIIDSKQKKNPSRTKSTIIKIGIAGFCFGNIMLLSIPEYIAGESTIEPAFKAIFKYLIIALIIPVLFYAATDYFKAAWASIKQGYLNVDVPIVLGISALTLRSVYEMFYLGQPGYFDSLAGFIFFLLIGRWLQSRTYDNLSFDKDYAAFFPLTVQKVKGQELITTRVGELEKGDIIKLRNHEILPINATLLEQNATFDYSFVTGESKIIFKHKDQLLYAGGKLNSATALLQVAEVADSSYLNELWNQKDTDKEEMRLLTLIDKVSKYFTITILAIAIIGFAYWYFSEGLSKSLEVFTSILIVACPCALALAAPFTYSNASRLLSKINVYLKDSSILERISKVETIVFDKTGTLTQKENTAVEYIGDVITEQEKAEIESIVSCSLHPLSKMLSHYLMKNKQHLKIDGYEEYAGKGIQAKVNDNQYWIGNAAWLLSLGVPIKQSLKEDGSAVFIAKNHELKGCFTFSNVYRSKILETLKQLQKNYKISILSGDSNYEEAYLSQFFNKEIDLNFNQSPEDKQIFIQKKKESSATSVMMLGDGINDAIALKESDIGIAVTEELGSFTPNADIIMDAESISKIGEILEFSNDCKRSLYICLVISLCYNVIGLGFAFTGLLSPFVAAVLMPLSSITVVIIAVGLTNFFANRRQLKL